MWTNIQSIFQGRLNRALNIRRLTKYIIFWSLNWLQHLVLLFKVVFCLCLSRLARNSYASLTIICVGLIQVYIKSTILSIQVNCRLSKICRTSTQRGKLGRIFILLSANQFRLLWWKHHLGIVVLILLHLFVPDRRNINKLFFSYGHFRNKK